ncbi:AsmA family protein [Methylicorpusculum oleiharenae]|uniref:AsmA family protein n=1 Tax=Methylicorpusculum oleiharenae TaxID=1338687 RepID=UPI00135B2861|nr:AsmA family protein [Methylicorpusculum oleiharenae]MCD2449701.1 AsmA family protein [Methylicorpusculum oleiharenae]
MGKYLKIAGIFFAGFVLLLSLGIVLFALTFDTEQLKPHIEKVAYEQLDRDVSINGPVELSFFPWLGFTAEKISVSNAPGFRKEVLAQLDRLNIRVKLLPLLSRSVEIDRITLVGLNLNLEKNAEGQGNWERSGKALKTDPTLPRSEPAKTADSYAQDTVQAIGALAIAGLTIERSQVSWVGQAKDDHWTITDFTLNTEALIINEPVPVKLSFEFSNPAAQLTNSTNLSANLLIKPDFQVFILEKTSLQTKIKSPSVPAGELSMGLTANISLDLNENRLKINDSNLQAEELSLSGDLVISDLLKAPQTEGRFKLQPFNLAKLLTRWGFSLPVMQNNNALTQASAEFSLKTTPANVLIDPLKIQLDDSVLQGSARIDTISTTPVTHFNLNIDRLNADNYLPAKDSKEKSTTLASPAAALAVAMSALPAETLKKINAEGSLTVDSLTIQKLKLTGLSLNLSARQGHVKTKQAISGLYQGAYHGSMDFNGESASTPKMSIQESIVNLQLEPLLTDLKGQAKFSGKLNLTTQLQSQSLEKSLLLSTLKGQFDFLVKDSVIKGFNLQALIDNAKTAIKGSPVRTDHPKDQTLFSEISGSGQIAKGVITNKDLSAKSSKLNAQGSGTIDLNSEQVNYKINAKLLKSKSQDKTSESGENPPITVFITGTVDQPVMTFDVAQFLIEQNKDKIEKKKDKLLKKLDKKFGPGASDLLKRFF